MFELARCSNLARLACRVSLSRVYSTAPNQPIIDVLQRCASRLGWRYLLAHRSPGLKEEDSSPTRNAYKVRSFQVAIAAIHKHDKPIRSGKEALKVRTACSSLDPFGSHSFQLRGIGLGIANRIDFFLQGKEYVCRRVRDGG